MYASTIEVSIKPEYVKITKVDSRLWWNQFYSDTNNELKIPSTIYFMVHNKTARHLLTLFDNRRQIYQYIFVYAITYCLRVIN